MELVIKNEEEVLNFNGIIKRNGNKFYAEIEVPNAIRLEPVISNIKGYHDTIGNITLLYNTLKKRIPNRNDVNGHIYVYESDNIISGYIDEAKIKIKSISLYFKELDYFFVEDRYTFDTEKMEEEFTITQKYKTEILFENENIKIQYHRLASMRVDEVGRKIFSNPIKIEVIYNESIDYGAIFEEITKMENSFGFVINKKMNLIEASIVDSTGIYHNIILKSLKKYEDVILKDFHIVDLSSKQLLKDVLEKYYTNEKIAASMNMYYEYIYNDLDKIFEFTSLVNTLELVLATKKYSSLIKRYALDTNEVLKSNNEKMTEILNTLSEEQQEFIRSVYRFQNVVLRDKFRYIFYKIFKLAENKKSENFISAIAETRNYYVHGTKSKNKLNSVDLVSTKHLLRNILYLLIVKSCSNERNILIKNYEENIPIIYNAILKSF